MIQRTRKNIIHAFNQLIKNHDIEQISVEMIIRKAAISKATFYRYFNDKYSVMNANYKELLDYYAAPENCRSYLELYELLYKHGIRNWKFLQRAFNTTGYNQRIFHQSDRADHHVKPRRCRTYRDRKTPMRCILHWSQFHVPQLDF